MINKVSFSMPQYRQAPAFKASPEQIAKDALAVDTKGGMTKSTFLMHMEDEKVENLRKAAEIIRKTQNNPDHRRARMLDEMAEID